MPDYKAKYNFKRGKTRGNPPQNAANELVLKYGNEKSNTDYYGRVGTRRQPAGRCH